MPIPNLSEADLQALACFRCRLRRFLRVTKVVWRRRAVTPMQYRLLRQIREGSTVSELDERLHLKHHSVVALISRCEAAGLLSYSPTGVDERRVEVCLTPSGERCLECAERLHRNELQVQASRFFVPGFGHDV